MAAPCDHRVLVPVDVLGGESVPRTVIDAFASVPVVLLGYREIPDQTAPEQAREQYGERARADLEELRSVFEDAGCDVTSRLAFTHDRLKTFERVVVTDSCDAVLLLNPAPILESVLVAIRGDVNVDYIARLLGTVLDGTDLEVTLLHVASDESRRDDGTELLETARDALVDADVDADRIDRRLVVDGSPTDAILEAAADHDLLVVGESRPSVRRYVFRDRAERLARETVDPVLVIRGDYLEVDEAADDDGADARPVDDGAVVVSPTDIADEGTDGTDERS
ncbi:universal stress protein [Natronolimnohabitans innermongolicus]|uniref:UspA domain-containing protein n=1 Tax=Natronolimnohabitans innermongolicus JCM 12255 TaxID=1227499 RepID=L9WX96_9EURY|nr:universal stress protein [Natronolimnohabitans innermongolicus]ELY52978.1 UspA domain-containing protein [Natronolimnohabitans innermongolicus JCM 12255]